MTNPTDNAARPASRLDEAIATVRKELDFALCRGPHAMQAREKRLAQIAHTLELIKQDHASVVEALRARADAAERRVAGALAIASASLREANQLYENSCHGGDERGQAIANVRISLASSIMEALTGASAK